MADDSQASNSRETAASQRRKFLVIVDDTPECRLALRFATRRAVNTGGGVMLLSVVPPAEFQHWLGVETLMQEEARETAEALLKQLAADVNKSSGIVPELVIRIGQTSEEMMDLLNGDDEISVLVLGASAEEEGPGPLVSALANQLSSTFPIPITIVPGNLSVEQIDALT
ncbi:MAG TPA: universal stress protein [Sneathiellales bacterium]|nr:universal stress protein [Sneathiellales bacterium]